MSAEHTLGARLKATATVRALLVRDEPAGQSATLREINAGNPGRAGHRDRFRFLLGQLAQGRTALEVYTAVMAHPRFGPQFRAMPAGRGPSRARYEIRRAGRRFRVILRTEEVWRPDKQTIRAVAPCALAAARGVLSPTHARIFDCFVEVAVKAERVEFTCSVRTLRPACVAAEIPGSQRTVWLALRAFLAAGLVTHTPQSRRKSLASIWNLWPSYRLGRGLLSPAEVNTCSTTNQDSPETERTTAGVVEEPPTTVGEGQSPGGAYAREKARVEAERAAWRGRCGGVGWDEGRRRRNDHQVPAVVAGAGAVRHRDGEAGAVDGARVGRVSTAPRAQPAMADAVRVRGVRPGASAAVLLQEVRRMATGGLEVGRGTDGVPGRAGDPHGDVLGVRVLEVNGERVVEVGRSWYVPTARADPFAGVVGVRVALARGLGSVAA